MKNKIIKKGFTLIELMVTVVIISILTAITLPAYQDYIKRAEITEGIASLSDLRVRLEQHFQDNRTYEGACEEDTLASLPTNLKYFTITCEELTSTGYLLKAEGSGFIYTVDEVNNKETLEVPKGWKINDNCWTTNKNGQCQ